VDPSQIDYPKSNMSMPREFSHMWPRIGASALEVTSREIHNRWVELVERHKQQ